MVTPYPGRDAENLLSRLVHQPAIVVWVASTRGSVPRATGVWMAVFPDAVVATIGGGNLEYQAIAKARARLRAMREGGRQQAAHGVERFSLGPALGQCCGGMVDLCFEPVTAGDAAELALRLAPALTPVALFGGGHVGHALVQVLAPLPFQVTWIDSRDAVFPDSVPAGVVCEHSSPPQAAVAGLAPHSRVLIMSFSHAEDLGVVATCLQRLRDKADLPYIGLIGSKTKWATFRRRLEARGFCAAELAHVTCPIGIPGISGKEPEVIAVAVAAQLLRTLGDPKHRVL